MKQTNFGTGQHFRDFFNHTNIGIAICNPAGEFLNLNEAFSKLIGYEENELYKMTFKDITHADDLLVEISLLEQSIKNNAGSYTLEKRYVRKDKTIVWVELFVSVLCDENNNPYQFIRSVKEITIRKKLIKDLQESESRFRKVFMSGFDCIILCTFNDGIYLDVNDSFFKLFEFERDEIIGKSSFELNIWASNDDKVLFREILTKGESVKDLESIYRTKTGKNGYVSVSAEKILIGDKDCIIARFREITNRKQTELDLIRAKEKAEENERKLKESQEMAKLGSWELDIDTGVFTFTDSFYKIYHTSAEKVGDYQMTINDYVSRFVHPDDSMEVARETKKAIETGDPDFSRYIEHRIMYDDGGIGYIGVRFFIVKDKYGKTIKTYGVNQDITGRKMSELELIKAKEKAEESDRLKTAFLHNMSHEIRTPLNAIMGFSKLFVKNFGNKEKLNYFANIIKEQGKDLLEIIDDILDIAKIESGQLTLHHEQFKLIELFDEIETVYNDYDKRLKKENVQFRINKLNCDNDLILYTDRGKLKQIFINLINNAFKFTREGEIEVSFQQLSKNELLFYVRDTGIGIPKEKHNEVFQRFVQVNSEISSSYGGTGLGLSIVKGLLDLLGGKIWIDSEKDKGSTFTFTLPF